jgi:hypothetical protein
MRPTEEKAEEYILAACGKQGRIQFSRNVSFYISMKKREKKKKINQTNKKQPDLFLYQNTIKMYVI